MKWKSVLTRIFLCSLHKREYSGVTFCPKRWKLHIVARERKSNDIKWNMKIKITENSHILSLCTILFGIYLKKLKTETSLVSHCTCLMIELIK
jgi:hypothetical protein